MGVLSAAILLPGCGWLTRRPAPPPTFANADIEASYKDGKIALLNGDYIKARRALMQIISRFPGENDLAQVQWLIAKSYDLEGRTSEALSEYKRFLANYPDHPNAPDAEDRIHRLEQPAPFPRPAAKKPVRVVGNLSTDYEYAEDLSPSPLTTLNRVSTRLDMQIRNLNDGRGKVIVSGLRTFDLEDSRNDRARIQKLYGDWRNQGDTFSMRAGRQPATAGSLSTRYDGVEAHYRPVASLALDAAAGFPMDFTRGGSLSTDARFYETGFSVVDLWHITGRFYGVRQFAESILDREAVGGNVQGTWGRIGLSGNVDYDAGFGAFNDRFLALDYALKDSLHFMVGRDVRKDPYLQMSTALQDPAAITSSGELMRLEDLVAQHGEAFVRDLASAHTIDSTDTRVGVRWTISPAWSTSADYVHGFSEITQSGGGRTTRVTDRVSAYVVASNAWRIPDTASVVAIHQTSADLSTETLAVNAGERLSSWATVQLKGRMEYTNFKDGGTTDSIRYIPGTLITLEPTPAVSLAAEAEYTMEDRLYEPGRTSLFSRLNLTVLF
jgi:tetratricopeptide (TPR) repeat protein